MSNNIRSIEDLQKEKEKLKIKMEVAEHAFFQSLHRSQRLTKSYLFSKIQLPALVVSTAVRGAQHFLADQEAAVQDNSSETHWLKQAVPVARTIIETLSRHS